MSSTGFFKKIFSIPMIIIYIMVYVFRFQIMIFILSGYVKYFNFGKAFTERLIGEFYFAESRHADTSAKQHFTDSMNLYKQELTQITDPIAQGRIEALLGSQYECGKGVEPDLATAKQWYESASKKGNVEAQQGLNQINQLLQETKGKATIGKQCVPPVGTNWGQ